jgi:hypothetical protein
LGCITHKYPGRKTRLGAIKFRPQVKTDQNLHTATHVGSTAHRRFDHSTAIRTLGHSDAFPIIGGNVVVYQFFTTLRAFHSCHTHTTLIANIFSHNRSPSTPGLSYFIQLGTWLVQMNLDCTTRHTN